MNPPARPPAAASQLNAHVHHNKASLTASDPSFSDSNADILACSCLNSSDSLAKLPCSRSFSAVRSSILETNAASDSAACSADDSPAPCVHRAAHSIRSPTPRNTKGWSRSADAAPVSVQSPAVGVAPTASRTRPRQRSVPAPARQALPPPRGAVSSATAAHRRSARPPPQPTSTGRH